MAEKFLMLLSPAKNLAKNLAKDPITHGSGTQPLFKKEIDILIDTLKDHSMADISELMHLSTKLAKLNYDRYQAFQPQTFNKQNATQALFTFNGQAYEALDASSLKDKAIDYLKTHLYILSGLYGFLRASDWMQPYRLEMGTSIEVDGCANLYEFWQDKLTKKMNALIKKEGFTHIVNCASGEYSKALNFAALDVPVINCQFKDFKNGQYKTIGIYAKKARGMMVRYLAEKGATSIKALKAFNTAGYQFSSEQSTEDNYVYLRKD